MTAIIIYGAGGHAKVVIDAIESTANAAAIQVADDREQMKGTVYFGYHVIGGRRELLVLPTPRPSAFAAIGDNSARRAALKWLRENGFELIPVVHAGARIGRGVRVGVGAFIAAGAVVNPDATVGEGVIINTGATIDHDCELGDVVHVAPGCHLCGNVLVGSGSLLGAGTIVIPGIRIGADVVVGAGSTVLADVPDGARIVGSPARPI